MFRWWFNWLFVITNIYQFFFTLNILSDENDKGLRHEKIIFVVYNLYRYFLKTVIDDLN